MDYLVTRLPPFAVTLVAVLALASCGGPEANQQPSPFDESSSPDQARPAAEPGPQADLNASLEPLGADPPRAGSRLRFVGLWAGEQRLCETAAWQFGQTEMRTPAGSVCRFDQVQAVPGGYDIRARCTAEAPETEDVLEIRFAESSGAMLFESESIAGAGLIPCD